MAMQPSSNKLSLRPGMIFRYVDANGNIVDDGVAVVQPKLDIARIDSLSGVEARKVQPKLVIPDLTTCLVGWRGWRVTAAGDGYRLQALGRNEIWSPKKPIAAECREDYMTMSIFSSWGEPDNTKPHDCPSKDCHCGVWAFRSLDEFKKMAESYHSTVVVGQVYLWGRVLECENGYRAQYAYPKELWLFNEEHESLGWIYNVPIRTLSK